MSDIAQNGCMVHRPTLGERFWRKAGYRYCLQELPEETDTMPGWVMTCIQCNFSFSDRVRLLFTGRLRVDLRQAMSENVETVVSAASLQILHPGEQF